MNLLRKPQLNLYIKILSFLIKKGKKTKAKALLDFSLFTVCNLTKLPLHYIFIKIFSLINVFVETKTVRVKRSSYIVPFSINLKRRFYLLTKWLVQASSVNKQKVSFSKKFIKEIVCVLTKQKSEVLNIKVLNNSKALVNKSNIHYRW
jgi:ribosomal protein S7